MHRAVISKYPDDVHTVQQINIFIYIIWTDEGQAHRIFDHIDNQIYRKLEGGINIYIYNTMSCSNWGMTYLIS